MYHEKCIFRLDGKISAPADVISEDLGHLKKWDDHRQKKMKTLVACIIIGFTIIPGVILYAESDNDEWRQFFTNSVGDTFSYDRSSISYHQDDELVDVMVRIVSGNEHSAVKEENRSISIDCPKKTFRRTSTEHILRDNSVRSDSKPGESNPISIGSPYFALSDRICKSHGMKPNQYKKP